MKLVLRIPPSTIGFPPPHKGPGSGPIRQEWLAFQAKADTQGPSACWGSPKDSKPSEEIPRIIIAQFHYAQSVTSKIYFTWLLHSVADFSMGNIVAQSLIKSYIQHHTYHPPLLASCSGVGNSAISPLNSQSAPTEYPVSLIPAIHCGNSSG